MFVLIIGCGRVGSSIAKRMVEDGHDVSVLDRNPESHALLDQGLERTWEDAGGRFTVGAALEVDALVEAGIEQADVLVCSTHGDNTNIVVAQIGQKRFQVPKVVVRVQDPARAEWYHQQGLQTVSPTQVAIEMLTEVVMGQVAARGDGAGPRAIGGEG
jgi:trk system potassium uptake protein TrkA